MALLTKDILSDIMTLASGALLDRKFAVAQVSTHWRRIALHTPLLWTRIQISCQFDCRRLALALARSGPSAPLDIDVRGKFAESDIPQLRAAMRALVLYAARIRTLETSEPIDAILNCGFAFPVLETLRVRCRRSADVGNIALSAPTLRVLALADVFIRDFDEMIADRLTDVRVKRCENIGGGELLTILKSCPNLVHLTFHVASRISYDELDLDWDIEPLRCLKSLDLLIPHAELQDVLDNIVEDHTVLPSVTISGRSPFMPDMRAALPRGFGPIVELEITDYYNVTVELRNNEGHVRRMAVDGRYESGAWREYWADLAETYRVQVTVRKVTILLDGCWNKLVEEFAVFPPSGSAAPLTLRALIDPDDADLLVDWAVDNDPGALGVLALPRLTRLEIGGCKWDDDSLPVAAVVYILQHISCDVGRTVEVSVDASMIADVEGMRELSLLGSEGGGQWKLLT